MADSPRSVQERPGGAASTALASTMIPIVISVRGAVQTPGIDVVGMAMLLQFRGELRLHPAGERAAGLSCCS
jgi:hypothetical protein